MAFIEYDKITAFPLAKNRTLDRKSNLFYEENIANIVNQLIDTQGFVITQSVDFMRVVNSKLQMPADKVFQFSLGGRLFTITSDSDANYDIMSVNPNPGQEVKVYAYIRLDDNGEVEGQDEGAYYEGLGLDIETNVPTDVDYKLLLFIIEGSQVRVPDESYLKLSLKSIGTAIKIIDGKRPI